MTIHWKRLALSYLMLLQAGLFASAAQAVEVDLSTFPDSGLPVPDGTVLSDQWASIGILFDASPANVDPIKDFGDALFFNPDQVNAIALFTFVIPGTMSTTKVAGFSIRPFFDPGESAELVGFDELNAVVDTDTVTPTDIGGNSQSITMNISGSFARVEWRSHGNPGIAANDISFEFAHAAPAMAHGLLVLVSLCLASFGVVRLRKLSANKLGA